MAQVAIPISPAHKAKSAYVHIPFCTVRCGYCDFNTYINDFGPGASRGNYHQSVLREIEMSKRCIEGKFRTVFFGGGTPTLLDASSLAEILHALPVATDAEVTIEANPETVTAQSLKDLASAGFTRVSVGMQSAVPKVLATLDRQHRPERLPVVAQWVRDAGLDFSVDLIYGTPGETLEDWKTSLEHALSLEPDHMSAYSLIVEPGTKLHAQVARGILPQPDPDEAADKYLLTDQVLSEAGFAWYEISNFARALPGEDHLDASKRRFASRHNLAYWRDWDWWGYGPGAHSHVGDTRWWNVKHPLAYAQRVRDEEIPMHEGEKLSVEDRELERLMLSIRTCEGVQAPMRPELEGLVTENDGRLILTVQGRLMADYVTRVLAGWEG